MASLYRNLLHYGSLPFLIKYCSCLLDIIFNFDMTQKGLK